MLRKLGVRDRVQAVIAAYDAGLAGPYPPPAPSDPGLLAATAIVYAISRLADDEALGEFAVGHAP